MSKTCMMGLAFSLTVLFLSAVVLGQQTPPGAAPIDCDQDNCITKVLNFPSSATAPEFQDVVNLLRTIVEIRQVYSNASEHTITLKGTAEQVAMTEKLVSVLDNLRATGGRNRSSVLVYEFQGHLSGTPRSKKILAQHGQLASTMCELSTCYVRALYLPDSSTSQLQEAVNKLRVTAHIPRIISTPSSHTIVFRGTAEQVASAERLTNE